MWTYRTKVIELIGVIYFLVHIEEDNVEKKI